MYLRHPGVSVQGGRFHTFPPISQFSNYSEAKRRKIKLPLTPGKFLKKKQYGTHGKACSYIETLYE